MSESDIRQRLEQLELENSRLKQENASLKQSLPQPVNSSQDFTKIDANFSLDEYKRYGRQMIVPEFGSLKSQIKLKNSKILVIGAGGLGCPAILYLSAAGVGKIGIVDDDTVEVSNLHRQVLHTTDNVGMFKCESAKKYVNKLNPHVEVETYACRLSNSNAFDIIRQYDLVLDCTDTPATRYLINDVSVICSKTIVSASGLKSEGQLTILNFNNKGPCYRCFHPNPPKPETVTTCADGGVIGPAIGLVGITMAMETIKLLTGFYTDNNFVPFLSQYSGFPQQTLRVFKMRGRQKTCAVCGDSSSITEQSITLNAIDYASFCGKINPNVLDNQFRITPKELQENRDARTVLLDVRPKEQFEITALANSINIPWNPDLIKAESIDQYLPDAFSKEADKVIVICRYGNDSQVAAKKLIEEFNFANVLDVKGGINRWSDEIDPTVPKY